MSHNLYIKSGRKFIRVYPTDLYATLRGIKTESLKRMRIAKTGKHKYVKIGKHYFYILQKERN